jgi:hypothetical protein
MIKTLQSKSRKKKKLGVGALFEVIIFEFSVFGLCYAIRLKVLFIYFLGFFNGVTNNNNNNVNSNSRHIMSGSGLGR